MFEQTNQTDAMEATKTEPEIELLDDADALDSTAEETTETTEQGAAAAEGTSEQKTTADAEVLTAKYNGKEIPLDKKSVAAIAQAIGAAPEDVITSLQKGLNYDKVAEERDRLRSSEEIKIIDNYAQIAGMGRAQYIELLKQNQRQAAQRYPEAPPEMLQELASLRIQQQERVNQQQAQEQRQKPWFELFDAIPEARGKEIPKEVAEQVAQGARPLEAYLKYKNTQLEQQLAATSKNEQNKQIAVGPVRSDAGDMGKDPFLSGLFDD